MPTEFQYDVFLSHSSKDKVVVRAIAEQLRADGLSTLNSQPSTIRAEAGTFRFCDPLNKERRFIPLRLDDAPIKRSPAQRTRLASIVVI